MSKKVTILLFALVAAVGFAAVISSTSAISTNNCSCHGGRSESLALLVGNTGNTLPTTLNVGQSTTVRVVLQHTVVGATLNNVINSVSASLASVSGHFSVSAPSVSLGSITGTGTVTATWTITGISAGADSMRITASGANPHNGISFSDTYSPAASITVIAPPPPPPPAAYTATITTVGGGTVAKTPNTATYTSGSMIQVTATPATGWSFTGWSDALTGTANPASITMNSNKAIIATFTQNPPPPPSTSPPSTSPPSTSPPSTSPPSTSPPSTSPPTSPPSTSGHEDDDHRIHEIEHEEDGHRNNQIEHEEDDHRNYDSWRSYRNGHNKD